MDGDRFAFNPPVPGDNTKPVDDFDDELDEKSVGGEEEKQGVESAIKNGVLQPLNYDTKPKIDVREAVEELSDGDDKVDESHEPESVAPQESDVEPQETADVEIDSGVDVDNEPRVESEPEDKIVASETAVAVEQPSQPEPEIEVESESEPEPEPEPEPVLEQVTAPVPVTVHRSIPEPVLASEPEPKVEKTVEPEPDVQVAQPEETIVEKPVTEKPAVESPSGDVVDAGRIINSIRETYAQYIVGQDEMLESIMVALLSRGHLLIEGVPGLAKTTAAHTIAATVGADFTRIQCTPDMLPADIVGSQIYNPESHKFTTQLGPVNHQFVLVDEVNRTSAKTQSALLEAMQERQVSIGGQTFALPDGFIVMATQNPIEQEGTYPLPEAQLDRFMLKHIVRYPSLDEEVQMLKNHADRMNLSKIKATVSMGDILKLQKMADGITTDDKVVQYVASIIDATRNPSKYGMDMLKPLIEVGASPRASLALLAAGRARALMSGSTYVTPDHIKPFLERVLQHRIALTYEAEAENITVGNVIEKIASVIQVP